MGPKSASWHDLDSRRDIDTQNYKFRICMLHPWNDLEIDVVPEAYCRLY